MHSNQSEEMNKRRDFTLDERVQRICDDQTRARVHQDSALSNQTAYKRPKAQLKNMEAEEEEWWRRKVGRRRRKKGE
jgi:hypothetical protein